MRLAICLGVLLVVVCASARADLAGYVVAKDSSYAWSRVGGSPAGGAGEYAQLHMVSQTWRQIPWQHQMLVVRPPEGSKPTHALLIITGGTWRDGRERELIKPDSGDVRIAQALAGMTRMPVAVLRQVPFQPILDGLIEDQLIAHTFDQYMKTGQEDWPLLLPMAKSAVRAMDTVQAFAREQWQMEISKFVVTGASKRGWTTWLTAATDPRVAGIAPMVIDVLNMLPQMKQQKQSYGGYSEQIADYTRLGIQDQMDSDAGRKLMAIVDPFAYRQRFTMPKLILLGTNDPYWTVDALNLYFDELPGPKHVLYVPNAGHGLNDMARVVGGVAALALSAAGQLKLPALDWQYSQQEDGVRLVVRSDLKPLGVSVWTASSRNRDFRKATWRSQPISPAEGRYAFELKAPARGFTAGFAEAVYEIEGRRLHLSTAMRVVGAE